MNTRVGTVLFLIPLVVGWGDWGAGARPKRVFQVPNGSLAHCRTCHIDRGTTTTRLDIPLSDETHEAANDGDEICASCHLGTSGGGPLNLFGVTVKSGYLTEAGYAGNVMWGPTLAKVDSDGDGFANGEELGDPEGVWKPGDPAPGRVLSLGNPGVRSSVPVSTETDPKARIRSDFNGDGKVSFADFVRFAVAFGTTREDPGFDPLFDLTGDGRVGFGDFVGFAQDFGKGG